MANKNTSDEKATQIGERDTEEMDQWHRNSGAARKRGGQPGNTNNLKHGVYANRFLSEEEKPIFNKLIEELHQDFVFNKSSDFMQVELVAVYFLKLGRAQEAGDWEAAERIDRMLRCHLKDLKTTKISREGDEPRGPGTTPAEWATALIEKLRRAEEEEKMSASVPVAEETPE